MHIENICRKSKYKLHALQRIRKYFSTDKAKAFNAFISRQFYYALLIQMFAEKLLISRLRKIHFQSLKQYITHLTDTTHDELLSMNSDVSVPQRHIRFLVTKAFKSVKNLNPYILLWDYFNMNFSHMIQGKEIHCTFFRHA